MRTKERKMRGVEKLDVDIDSEEANAKDPQTVCGNESPSQKFLMEFLR